MRVLAVDIGTTSLKMGIFDVKDQNTYTLVDSFSESYPLNTYTNPLWSDIDSELWKTSFRHGCLAMKANLAEVESIGLSGTTPGFTPMDKDGNALHPSMLMFDQRSRIQAKRIIDTVGKDEILRRTGNIPVAGGCSLSSLLWLRDTSDDIDARTACYGHSNTVIGAWLTGNFAIDPSSVSLFGLNDATKNNQQWDDDLLKAFAVSREKLPSIIQSYDVVGTVRSSLAQSLGFALCPSVIIGGNDATVATYSLQNIHVGDVINVNGTCEISSVFLDMYLPSQEYNLRSYIIPEQWITLYVMNAGGKAYEWFKSVYCSEMDYRQFFDRFIPAALNKWKDVDSDVEYVPYLMGSRYSLEPLKASFINITQETTREEMVVALIKGLCNYQSKHLNEIEQHVHLTGDIFVTGGAVTESILEAKRKWYRNANFHYVDQSSLLGAAMLAAREIIG